MRLVFMGTPPFAATTLEALATAGRDIAAVYTQPPRPAGRGKAPTPSAAHRLAERLGIPVRTPLSLKTAEEQESLRALEADAAVVVAYGVILPQAALDAPRLGCFNLHASLLPRWRGAAPIQRAIMAGDAVTGVCVMRMEAGLDTGPVLRRAETPIGPEDTAATMHDRLAEIGAPLMAAALDDLAVGRAVETPQDDAASTYAAKIDKAEARIDWTEDAAALDRKIRGLSPRPGAWFEAPDADGAPQRMKVLLAAPIDGAVDAPPGTVSADGLSVACGSGALAFKTLQRAGRGQAPAAEVLRGFPLRPGSVLPNGGAA